MSFKSSLFIGIAVLALSAPAMAQTTTGAPPTTTNGSMDQIGAGSSTAAPDTMSTDMNATATKHHARKHHKHHTKMRSTQSSTSSEMAETNRLNQQQLSQARSGSSTATAAGAGSQNENAATYSNGSTSDSMNMGNKPNMMSPPVAPGSTPAGPNNTPSDANPGAQPNTSPPPH